MVGGETAFASAAAATCVSAGSAFAIVLTGGDVDAVVRHAARPPLAIV